MSAGTSSAAQQKVIDGQSKTVTTHLATSAKAPGEVIADLDLVLAGVGIQGLGICVDSPELDILSQTV